MNKKLDSISQRIVIVAGSPATGKTSVMMHVIPYLQAMRHNVAVAKIDCLETEDDIRYSRLNIPVVVGLSKDICPDHFYVVNLEEIVFWAKNKAVDILIVETAGLCHRCAPGTDNTLAVCVVDCLSSIKIPQKIGPVLTTADIIVTTKGDIVSQAEKEVFQAKIRQINKKAVIIEANGLTGGGSESIGRLIIESTPVNGISDNRLRHSMPMAVCSYCMGETRLGSKYQHGVVYKMKFSEKEKYKSDETTNHNRGL